MRAAMALRLKRWLQKGSIVPFPDPNHQAQFLREATNLELDPNEPDTLAEEDPSLIEDPEYQKAKLLQQLYNIPENDRTQKYDPLTYMSDLFEKEGY